MQFDFETAQNWSSVEALLIKNLSTATGTSTYVNCLWFNQEGTIANPGGDGIDFTASSKTITDASSSGIFSVLSVGDIIYNDNAENSSNRISGYVLTKASSNVITVSSTVVDDTDDTTVTWKYGRLNTQRILPGRWAVIPGNLMTVNIDSDKHEIALFGYGSACKVEITAFGS